MTSSLSPRAALALGSLACVGVMACGGASSDASGPPVPTSSSASEPTNSNAGEAPGPAPSAPSTPSAPFEVHEWGVVDVPLGGPSEVGAGPGQPSVDSSPHPVRKPVVYFHLDPGASPLEVEVSARIPRGSVIEVWPNLTQWPGTTVEGDTLRWPSATLGACSVPLAPASARGLIPQEQRACDAPDGYCEIYDLPTYMTSDASCLTHGGVVARLLFYRGAVAQPSLPLTVARDAAGQLALSASEPSSAGVLYVAGGRGIELPWPAPGAEVGLPEVFSESFDGPALARVMAGMVSRAGLSGPETDAFMAAWSQDFFGTPWQGESTRDLPEREPARWPSGPGARRAAPPPAPVLLYVMPESTVSRVAELTITPAPRVLRRVMVVRVELAR